MANQATIDLRLIARGLNLPLRQVQAAVELLDEGNTVPFITRYRKDQTGGLDEEQIRHIQADLAKLRQLAERKQTILRSIETQGRLTDELARQIHAAATTKRLEDLYLPYKPKKQTLATQARQSGLEPLADEIFRADPASADLDGRAAAFVSVDRNVPTPAAALLGAGHILAEQFSERAELRQRLREIFHRTGKFVCTQIGGEPKPVEEPAAEPAKPEAEAETSTESPPQAEVEAEPAKPEAEAETSTESPPQAEAEAESAKPEAEAETPTETPPPAEAEAESAKPEAEAETPTETPPPAEAEAEPAKPEAEAETSTESPLPAETEAEPAKPEAEAEAPTETPPPAEAGKPAETPPPAPKASAHEDKKAKQRAAKEEKRKQQELKRKKVEERKIKAFQDYFHYTEEIRKIPPHRILAINRGERAKVLRVKTEVDFEAMCQALDEALIPPEHPHADYLRGCARDALSRLIVPSLEREIRRELTDRAEMHAVTVFARNLRNLLLQPPVRDRRVLAVDPGFKNGCKLAALDQFGNILDKGIIYLVGRASRRKQAQRKVLDLINRFQLTVVVIGNGTACRATEEFVAEMIEGELKQRGVSYVIVNEAGASVYSTSRTGREEFPHYDASLRGAITIGRRLQDPLSELVKIDPANIGVGLYQHDVKAKHLQTSLDGVVESCVNYVGVDVNTASPALLRYVSGLNQLTARRVYEYRHQNGPFRSRAQLQQVPGFGEATFVQAAGFLKIAGGDNPLDATWIHPESYEIATRVLERFGYTAAGLADKEKAAALAARVGELDLQETAEELGVGTLLLRDILAQLARPGRDPRDDLPAPVFKQGILKLEDLSSGMELTGTVLNVVDFGCFVDIGMHDSGLVHVSQLADKFVRDPYEVVSVGDVVKVWVTTVDKQRRRVSLTMIPPGTERPRQAHGSEKSRRKKSAEGKSDGKKERRGEKRTRDRRGRTGKPKGGARSAAPPKRKDRVHKPPPRPVVPITDAMKKGQEPMRTFGDLMQFYEHKDDEPDSRDKQEGANQEPDQPQTAENPEQEKSE